jgi:hypothetical protein
MTQGTENTLRADGGHRLATDRVDGTLLAECPNAECEDDDHLQVEIDYEHAVDNDLADTFIDAFPECGECAAELNVIAQETPVEVLE